MRRAMNSQMEITAQEKQELEQGIANLKSQETMDNWWAGRQEAQKRLARKEEMTDEDRDEWHDPERTLKESCGYAEDRG